MLVLLGTFAFSAISAGVASAEAPQWWVAEKLLTGTSAVAEATNVTAPMKIETAGLTFECKKVKVKNGFIEAPGKVLDESEVFEECSVVGQSGCSIPTTESFPLKATLERVGEAIKLKFEAQAAGNELAVFKINGAGCTVTGTYKIDGTMVCDYPGVETESLEHPLEFTATSGSKVKVGTLSATFTGTVKVWLASGQKWSAR
jgi:hypothetical protein